MTKPKPKTVKGLAILASSREIQSGPWVGKVFTYGKMGDYHTIQRARKAAKEATFYLINCDSVKIIPITITLD
jgi:hypothetical protein